MLLWCSVGLAEERVVYNRDIQPILSDRCFLCHGPDAENRQADLRLDTPEGAHLPLEFADGSHAIKPGDPEQSEVWLRITADDPDLRMPPAGSNLSLTKEEIDLLRRWIEQGAEYEKHWAFVPPSRRAGRRQPPDGAESGVGGIGGLTPPRSPDTWPRNEIDGFILQGLRDNGLDPAPEAPREKLIRRVTFDLTGLPPTLAEIDAFLADDSPDAYEKVVDRLLASSRYGERMASDWLDAARYSDTYGYQVDRDRFVWPWRDWVIRAFNGNMPYDRFLTEQLAGDLLPDATDDQILATTFNRLHPQETEGGSVPEEFRMKYIFDRTETVGTAILGLTLECSRCHDHKYDPIRQKDYYQLSAFFDNIDEAGLYSFFTDAIPTPTLLLASEGQKQQLAEIERRIADEERKLGELRETRREAFREWLASGEASAPRSTSPPALIGGLTPPRSPIAALDFETVKAPNVQVPGKVGSAIKLTGDDPVNLEVGNFRRFEPFSVSLWINTPDEKERAVIFHRSRAWTDAGSRGYELLIEEGRLCASLIHFWPGNAISIRTLEKIPVDTWLHVTFTYDGSSRADGLRLFVNGEPAPREIVRDHLTKNITGGGGDNIAIGERFRDRGFTGGLVDEFSVLNRQLTRLEILSLSRPEIAAESWTTLFAGRTPEDQDALLYEYYLMTVDGPYREQLAVLQQVREQRSQLVDPIPEIMVMRELPQPKPSRVLTRGEYNLPADEVEMDTPEVFPPFPADTPRNRLGLARWLTQPDHPLTARVAVNRYWQMLMGTGLVRTPEDFGSQGERPTHPELLDWLARDFIDHGWDVQRLLKQIVMSATYRQSSAVTPEKLAQDPTNRWLSRAPSYRLPAEMLRDNALAASGLLVDRIGGPPAKPYEIEVSFKPVPRDKGEGLYRRSVYTYWKRMAPAPVMTTLDAAKRDVCQVNRERTASPLQSLVMLNGPQFVESARMLAQQLMQLHGDKTDTILIDLFRTLTSRRPTDRELNVLRQLYGSQQALFAANRDKAVQYLAQGDAPRNEALDEVRLAAFGVVANMLLNYDECVIRR